MPKALSAPTTTELGTKTRSDGGAVLLADKTIPCPNKLGPMLTNFVTGCHPLSLRVTYGSIPFGEPDAKKNHDLAQLLEGQNR